MSQLAAGDAHRALRDEVAALAAECRRLGEKQDELKRKLEEKKKDGWDKLGLSGPLFIGAIGLLLSGVLHIDSATRADITRAANERAQDLQSFSIFLPYLTSIDSAGQGFTPRDSIRQELAIRALRQLGSCNLAGLAAGLYPSPGTRAGLAGLLELKRPESVAERDDCGFADTVWNRVFLDTTQLTPIRSVDSLPEGVSRPVTRRGTTP
jgi:hypothetical protein